MLSRELTRRGFVAGAATAAFLPLPARGQSAQGAPPTGPSTPRPEYRGPNVVLIRFGGGARRRESVDPDERTYSPYLRNELAPRGVLFSDMRIDTAAHDTGHGHGTLNLLTGVYDRYHDIEGQVLGERFEARVPTLFEYLRREFDVPEHQTLIVNGEDRTQEEFYTFSNHHLFGVNYRSEVLSLFRFKTHLLREQLAATAETASPQDAAAMRKQLAEMEALDYRVGPGVRQSTEVEDYWRRWRRHYGESGLTCPRGDRLLTELAVRAIRELRPKLMMVNYNDCDYVHWGNLAHYTTGIAVMDRGIRRLVETVEADDEYRDNTIFVIAPDCGRDDSRLAAVPCQHHFNTPSSREIFAVVFGAGVDRGRVVDSPTEQNQVAATIAQAMGYRATHAEGGPLAEAFA